LAAFDCITYEVIENHLKWVIPAFPYCVYSGIFSSGARSCCPSFEIRQPPKNGPTLNLTSDIREFPQHICLSVLHYGDYESIHSAYQTLDAFAREHSVPVFDIYIERYIINKDNTHMADTPVTEVLLPIDIPAAGDNLKSLILDSSIKNLGGGSILSPEWA
jgi:hypothetical protein